MSFSKQCLKKKHHHDLFSTPNIESDFHDNVLRDQLSFSLWLFLVGESGQERLFYRSLDSVHIAKPKVKVDRLPQFFWSGANGAFPALEFYSSHGDIFLTRVLLKTVLSLRQHRCRLTRNFGMSYPFIQDINSTFQRVNLEKLFSASLWKSLDKLGTFTKKVRTRPSTKQRTIKYLTAKQSSSRLQYAVSIEHIATIIPLAQYSLCSHSLWQSVSLAPRVNHQTYIVSRAAAEEIYYSGSRRPITRGDLRESRILRHELKPCGATYLIEPHGWKRGMGTKN